MRRKYSVQVGDKSTNVISSDSREAIQRAVTKLWGKGHSFLVSSDQHYTDPEAATLWGVILRHVKGGGGNVARRVAIRVHRITG
jgi:hypothetical protein